MFKTGEFPGETPPPTHAKGWKETHILTVGFARTQGSMCGKEGFTRQKEHLVNSRRGEGSGSLLGAISPPH